MSLEKLSKLPPPLVSLFAKRTKSLISCGVKNVIAIDVITTDIDEEVNSKIDIKKDTIDDLFIKAHQHTWYFLLHQTISKKDVEFYKENKKDFETAKSGMVCQFGVLQFGVFQVVTNIPSLFGPDIQDKLIYWPRAKIEMYQHGKKVG